MTQPDYEALLVRVEELEKKLSELENHVHSKGTKYSDFTREPMSSKRAYELQRMTPPW